MKATGQPLRSPRPMSRQAHRSQRTQRAFRATLRHSVAAVAACFATGALANPTAPTVVNGTASFNQTGNLLTVTNSNGAVIHWNTFSIASGETTRFIQPSSASSVLNRVLGGDPSAIYGTLSSNGHVWLVNPAGILVGPGGRIDVAGFVASTLNVSTADFLANRLTFNATPGAGNVVNQGEILTPAGGSVYLVGTNVSNEGLITTPQGETILAAGQTVGLLDTATPGVKVEITGEAGNATNLGQIVAEAGRIGIAGVIVRNSGTLNASSAVSEGGKIFLRASRDAYVDGDGRIVATGATGGRVEVLGDRVAVMDRAEIDASGVNGGGIILVGGDYLGKNPDIQNASVTFFGADATLKVDAQEVGAGGTAIVWADDTTRAYGTISARGGANGGDGGFVETSGKRYLAVDGIRVDTRAPRGATGTWLLDPDELTILNGTLVGSGYNVSGGVFSTTSADATIYDDTIQTALDTTSVILQTSGAGGDNGSISADGVSITSGSGNSLTLAAYGVGAAAGDISLTNSLFDVNGGITLLAGWDGIDFTSTSIADSGGNITLSQSSLLSGGPINLWAGGLITLQSDGSSSTVVSSGAAMDVAASGLKLLAGDSLDGAGLVKLEAADAQTITIHNGGTLEVRAGNGNYNEAWVRSGSQTITFTAGGLLTVHGGGGGNGNIGSIESDSSQFINAPDVDIFLTGGTSGGDIVEDQINDGSIGAETWQEVYARNVTINGGSATYGGAGFFGGDAGGSSQYFELSGNLVMNGGSSANPHPLASPAFIGTEYGGNTVTLNVGGSITLNGGSGAGGPVLIGSLTDTAGETVVNVSAQRGITATGNVGGIWLGVKELSGNSSGSAVTLRSGWYGLGEVASPSGLGGNLLTSGSVNIQTDDSGSVLIEAYESDSATLGDITLGAGTMVSSGTVTVAAQGHNTIGGMLETPGGMTLSAGFGGSARGGNLLLTNTSNLLAGGYNLEAWAGTATPYGGGNITQAGSLESTSGHIDIYSDRNLAINGSVISAGQIYADVGYNGTNAFGGNLSFGAGSNVSAIDTIEMFAYAGADALGAITQAAGSSIASDSYIGLYADNHLTLNGAVTTPDNLFLYAGLDNAGSPGDPSYNSAAGGNIAFGAGSVITGGHIEMFANRGSVNTATGNVTQAAGGLLHTTPSLASLYIQAAGSVKLLGTTQVDGGATVDISAGYDTPNNSSLFFPDKQIQIASLIAPDSDVYLKATGAISANTEDIFGIEAIIWNSSSGGIVIRNHTTTGTQPDYVALGDAADTNRSVSFTHTGSDLTLTGSYEFYTMAPDESASGAILVATPTSNLTYTGATLYGSSAILSAGNTLAVDSSLFSDGNLALIAPVVDISDSVSANGNLLVAAGTLNNSTNSGSLSGYNLNMIAGNINGNSGAHFMASNVLNATVANNIVLADGAHFHAGGDINLTMSGAGSEIRLSNGSYMHAGAPTTIHIDFITRTSGGIFIDGISTIANNGSTGFFVGSLMTPAVPGAGLDITYANGNQSFLAILDSNTNSIYSETEEERQRRLYEATQFAEGNNDDANKPVAQCS